MGLENLVSVGGIAVFLLICFALSADRKAIAWRTVVWGLVLQFLFALLILKTDPGRWFFAGVNRLVLNILSYEQAGAEFVFGSLATSDTTYIFAFQVLPTIIFFASLMGILYHLRVVQWVVAGLARIMKPFMGTSGAETFAVAANVFLGYIESPLLIRPYLKTMTRSELVTVMTAGMATVAGGVMIAFVGMLRPYFPDIAGHLLAASVMSVPAAIAVAKMLVPETLAPETVGHLKHDFRSEYQNIIDAAASGATNAVRLVLNIAATLIAFMALLALLNGIVGWLFTLFGMEGVTIQWLLSFVFSPIAWIMGVPWHDCLQVGQLIGEKLFINEFVAYIDLRNILEGPTGLATRSSVIATYALCGFANFLSLGAMMGGMIALVPERKRDIAKNGFIAMVGGTIASFLTASIAGILLT